MIHFTFSPLQIKRFFTNLLITFIILAVITASSFYLLQITSNSACIILQYILGLVLIARYTDGYWYGIFASLISIFCVNFLFTYPYFAFNFTLSGYPITFFCMSFISLITSLTTTNLKKQTKVALEREKLLQEAEKEKLRANLLRAVSHDLRTPLTGIIGSSATYLENKERLAGKQHPAVFHRNILHIHPPQLVAHQALQAKQTGYREAHCIHSILQTHKFLISLL